MDPALAIEVEALSRVKVVDEALAAGDSDVQLFYADAVIFVTGGTGFLGKQLVEKLLRACNVKKIYLLIRPKKNKTIQERMDEIFADSLFDNIRGKQEPWSSRVVCVEGDVAQLRLGLSERDWHTITKDVEVVFHIAATTRFDENLRIATLINVRGTRETLLLAKQSKRLKSFVHVSTAYAHTTKDRIGSQVLEQFYPTPMSPDIIMKLVDGIDDERLHGFTASMLKEWPNTYTFTKAIAEEQVRVMAEELPVCIVRPSAVISSYQEPNPGWLDTSSVYSASGIITGQGLGFIRTVHLPTAVEMNLVPVDYVVNACIAAGWDIGVRQTNTVDSNEKETPVYNMVASPGNKLTCGEMEKSLFYVKDNLPSPKAIWSYIIIRTESFYTFFLMHILLHMIPAYLVDGVYFLLGKERRLVRLYKKAYKLMKALGYFISHTHQLDDTNLTALLNKLSKTDRKIFDFDMKRLNWPDMLMIWCIGIRKYLIKDGLKDTEKAKSKQFWLKIVSGIIFCLYVYVIYFLMSNGLMLLYSLLKMCL